MATPTTPNVPPTNVNSEYSAMMKKIEKELEEVYETEDGEEFCFQLSNEIIRIASIMIEERHFERESIQYTVDDCVFKMFNVLDVGRRDIRSYYHKMFLDLISIHSHKKTKEMQNYS